MSHTMIRSVSSSLVAFWRGNGGGSDGCCAASTEAKPIARSGTVSLVIPPSPSRVPSPEPRAPSPEPRKSDFDDVNELFHGAGGLLKRSLFFRRQRNLDDLFETASAQLDGHA